jgi:PAS domain S-box-containing protein
MLEQLSEQIRLCHERAADAKARADTTNDPAIRAEFLAAERHWLTLARSYGFTESLEDFTTANAKQRRAFDERLKKSSAPVDEVHKNLDGSGDILQLHEISTLLIQEGNLDSLYNRILDAAINLMSSDMASMQLLDPESSQLRLLAWKGFHPQSASFWEWVHLDSASTCGLALFSGSRVVVPDVETCDFMAGTADLDEYRRSNIRAVQSTPLISRSGQLLGMISTHWRELHQPTEHALRRLDVLARQAADLIERSRTEVESQIEHEALGIQPSSERAERLASLLTLSYEPMFVWQLNGPIEFWNTGAERLYGFAPEEAVGRSSHALLQTKFPVQFTELITELQNKRYWSGELRHICKDGREVIVESRQQLLSDGTVIEVNRDVAERRQIEADLRKTENWLVSIIQSSDDAIVSKNLDGIITSWNKGAERVFGYTAEEAVGQPITIVIPQDRQGEEREILTRIRSGERIDHFETVRRRKDASLTIVSLTISPIKNAEGKIVGASKIARDITEQKRGQEIRQELSNIVEASRDAIWSWTADGTITSWNREAERMLGYTAEEMLGKSLLTLMPRERQEAAHDVLAKVSLGKGYGPLETVRLRKDGKPLPVELSVSPIRDSEGRVVAAATICRDITEREQAKARIASDLHDMMRLNELSNRLVRESSEHDRNLNAVVDTAIAITGAVKGSLRLLDPTNRVLILAAQRGFGEPYLNFFASMPVEASAYAAAMKSGERVIIEDMRESEILAGQPSKEVLLEAGVCAVTSTPLLASTGNLLGMVSTHFTKPHRPSERELHLIDLLARQTADYLERKRASEIQATLVHEIQHRGNNLLAVIQTIANCSLSGNYSLAEAKAAFEARLLALARSNRNLSKSNWIGVDLKEIVRSELEPFLERAIIEGDDVSFDAKQSQNLSLALHELATNAAKYGALSNGSGTVRISWATILGETAVLKFTWRETGGPPVAAPTRHGFGTALLKATFPGARVAYARDGLCCEIDFKLDGGHANSA